MDMTVTTFLDLVSNADKYKAKLKELTDHEANIKTLAAQLGKLSEAHALRTEAEKLLETAKKEVSEMISVQKKAEAVRKEILDNEFKEVAEQRRTAGDIRQQGLNAKKQAEGLLAEVNAKEKALNKERLLLEEYKKEVQKLKSEYEERIAKLRSVMT